MYSWSPSLAAAWRRLLEWVAASARVPMSATEEAGSPSLEELWGRDDLACAFMCGYPWALRDTRPQLLAAPVPSPPRYGGQPIYYSDFVVRADSRHQKLEDTFWGILAYSTERSHSGYNAPRYHLLRYRTVERPTLYGRVLGPYGRQRPVLETVIHGEADVAAIDSYALDLLRRHDPELASRVRVIASTEPAPSPPLVASPQMDPPRRDHLIEALVNAHRSPEISGTLEALLLVRFVRVEEPDFQVFLDRERAAKEADYPRLS